MVARRKLITALVLAAGVAPLSHGALAAGSTVAESAGGRPHRPVGPTSLPVAESATQPAGVAGADAAAPAPAANPAPTADADPGPVADAPPVPAPSEAAELDARPTEDTEAGTGDGAGTDAGADDEAEAGADTSGDEVDAPVRSADADITLYGAAAEFLAATNASRAAVGVAPLAASAELSAYAAEHVATMAGADYLHHSNIQVLLGSWSTVGENVGIGPTVDDIHEAMVASPTHYANLADALFTHVGIATLVDARGRLWTATVFGV